MAQTRSVFELTLRATNPVLDCRVNLLLNRAFSRPARCHVVLLQSEMPVRAYVEGLKPNAFIDAASGFALAW